MSVYDDLEREAIRFRYKDVVTSVNDIIVNEKFHLTDWDVNHIKDTDINEEDYKNRIISLFSGLSYNEDAARLMFNHWANTHSYKFKYWFSCKKCGKEDYVWLPHEPMAFISYDYPTLCGKHESSKRRRDKFLSFFTKKIPHWFKFIFSKKYREDLKHPNLCGIPLYKCSSSIVPANEVVTVWKH